MKLVIWPEIDSDRLNQIQAVSYTIQIENLKTEESATQAISNADAFYGKMTPQILQQAEKLRWIQSPTASLEHYIFPELVDHPATLTNMKGLFSDVIADHVMGYVISFARNLHLYRDQQADREWSPIGDRNMVADFVNAPGVLNAVDKQHRHLADCTMLVVGVGAIGSEVARRARAFGMAILGVDPQPRAIPGILEKIHTLSDLGELLPEADFVVIAAPHTPTTEGMFDRELMKAMRSDAYLINIGRGAIIPLDDLRDALLANEIAGTALDVCQIEPLPESDPLWSMPNVIITPHVAAASPRVPERHLQTLIENVRRFVSGNPLLNVVDKEQWC